MSAALRSWPRVMYSVLRLKSIGFAIPDGAYRIQGLIRTDVWEQAFPSATQTYP